MTDLELPELYKLNKSGKEIVWKVSVSGNTVTNTHGQVGGKMITTHRTFSALKVGGVTAEQNARSQADSMWTKKTSKGYTPKSAEGKKLLGRLNAKRSDQGGTNVGISKLIRGGTSKDEESPRKTKKGSTSGASSSMEEKPSRPDLTPMHCAKWEDKPACLKYFDFDEGVWVQPKLDGVRCMAYVDIDGTAGGRVVMLSRSGKELVFMDSLREEIMQILGDETNLVLDGEIYAPVMYGELEGKNYVLSDSELPRDQRFEVISGAARPVRKTPHPLEDQLEYHVFDIIDPSQDLDQNARFELLDTILGEEGEGRVKRVKTVQIHDAKQISKLHDEFFAEGYEGIVVRSGSLKYRSDSRSLEMRKYKSFVDKEVVIIGVEKDDGVGDEHFTWICYDPEKSKEEDEDFFNVKMRGTREQKIDYYNSSDEYVGKQLTIRFQDYTSSGKPRFPVGIAIRED